ncbi:aminotransferase class V-fold PLP-dependent enzyme [Rhodobacteraceae bacterium 2CG4]|uniref:Cysteine desulfurase n=1 Tax=Halovulum marinum TaxID=2662447 RepID=A0A6L5Z0B2_9RHOB|nr:aminotransferase class V-fold PLP-dependent enzyme [Halovulum marinum]MSU89967.1 aminotransferase class V-fold PLP-dependent enzyme [Halovulum marinum]
MSLPASRIYLDWNATAPLRDAARSAMLAAMDVAGNPSSVHAEGRAARGVIERARAQVAAAVGCQRDEVVFTSGATEAAMVLAQRPPGAAVCVDDLAHDALWAHFDLTGADDPQARGHTLAMGVACGETGLLRPVPERVDGRWPFGAVRCDRLLLDATQAVGRVPFAFSWSGAELAVLSAHKLGGPKGVGALILRDGLDIGALALGGGQELGRRSGTENVIGIAGFGAAAEAALRDQEAGAWRRVEKLRNLLEKTLQDAAGDIIFVGRDQPRLPNTSCFAVPGWKGETQVMQLDLAGYAISAGSACSSGKVKESRVLRALGHDGVTAASAIRVSLGPVTTQDEIIGFAEAWTAHYRRWKARAA